MLPGLHEHHIARLKCCANPQLRGGLPQTTVAIMVMAVLALTTTSASAQQITIVNPGFEDPPYADGAWGETTAWTDGGYYLPDMTTWHEEDWGSGGYNPSAAERYGGVAPEGLNVVLPAEQYPKHKTLLRTPSRAGTGQATPLTVCGTAALGCGDVSGRPERGVNLGP